MIVFHKLENLRKCYKACKKSDRLVESINTQKMRVVIPFDFLQKSFDNMLSKRFFTFLPLLKTKKTAPQRLG